MRKICERSIATPMNCSLASLTVVAHLAGPGSLSKVTLQRISLSSKYLSVASDPAAVDARLRQRWTAALEEHAAQSQQLPHASSEAPQWSLCCSREADLQRLCLAMAFNCTAQQVSGV